MARFEVVGVKRGACPSHEESRHIIEAEIDASDGLRRVGVSVLRLMLSSGDDIFTTSPTSGAKADVTKGRCACGFKTIRSVRRDITDNDVTMVPPYS